MSEFAAMYALGMFSPRHSYDSSDTGLEAGDKKPLSFVFYRFKNTQEANKAFEVAWNKVWSKEKFLGCDRDVYPFNDAIRYSSSQGNGYDDSVTISNFANDCIVTIKIINHNGDFLASNWLIARYLEDQLKSDKQSRSE